MKRLLNSTVHLVVACGLCATCAADSFPPRKPGLWQIEVAPQGGKSPGPMKQCIDKNTDEKMQTSSVSVASKIGGSCTPPKLEKTSRGFETTSTCIMAGSKILSRGEFTGDFNSSYVAKVRSTFEPPMMGQRESSVDISAKWLGECGPKMKPGDIVLPTGQTINLDTLENQARMASDIVKNPAMRDALKNALKGLDPKQLESMGKQLGGQP